ncbi:hypothetical protein [Baekduia sp. Peel2402]|uniref:hypothetical protein n=1 Tax=Baekduia sp. Peel2402 TaxID=3458296 RepID=UPI00403E5410
MSAADRDQRVAAIRADIAQPGFALLQEAGHIRLKDQRSAATCFDRSLLATIEAQRDAALPTAKALHERGGPKPHTLERFLWLSDLSPLPGALFRRALDRRVIARPKRLVLDARTETTIGPDKFGAYHEQAPPNIYREIMGPDAVLPPTKASNTPGGVATITLLADCDGVYIPVAAAALAQNKWAPSGWPGREAAAEQALRMHGELFDEPFIVTREDVAQAVIRMAGTVEDLAPWEIDLNEVPITCGRLRSGLSVASDDFGTGTRDIHVGTDLRALAAFGAAGMPTLLELPRPSAGATVTAATSCDWEMAIDGRGVTLTELEAMLYETIAPWTRMPSEIVAGNWGRDRHVFAVRTTAHAENLPEGLDLTLVAAIREDRQRDFYVTSLRPHRDEDVTKIVRLVADETERRRRDSGLEVCIGELLGECFLQRNRRRRFPDRRGFAGLAQAAYGVRRYADLVA